MDTTNQKAKALAQIRDTQDTIAKLNQGKFTFGGIFKSTAEKKESVVLKEQLVEDLKRDVENYDVIRKILIIYLQTVAIPQYQKQAKERYIKQMGLMCRSEVHNAAAVSNCWHSFKELIDSYNIKE